MSEEKKYCGSAAIVGRPNVGKSTLLNSILGEKVSITSHKPQTTRHRILGVKTQENHQIIFLDTPGFHKKVPRQLNRFMNRTVISVLLEADFIIFVIDCTRLTDEDEIILEQVKKQNKPTILVINKVDRFDSKLNLLPLADEWGKKMDFIGIVPLSALKNDNLAPLEKLLYQQLPENKHLFAQDDLTNCSDQFLVAEIIREKLMRCLDKELPYSINVQVEKYEEQDRLVRIAALIWVEKPSQKGIVIGKNGALLKKIGELARKEIEWLTEKKVFLHLWVKVKTDWPDDPTVLEKIL